MRAVVLSVLAVLLPVSAQARRTGGDTQPALIAPGGLPVFFASQGPLAYAGLTRSELPSDAIPVGQVTGRSCQYSLAIPLAVALRSTSISGAVGNGSYNKIFRKMDQRYPGLRGIYDAKIDLQRLSILGIFGKLCTEITAQGYR